MWGCFFPGILTFRLSRGLPHACGGVSEGNGTPPAQVAVFPTHVGVFPEKAKLSLDEVSLPHACGGVSKATEAIKRVQESSPRMWGCFCLHTSTRRRRGSLPHACGGVSVFMLLRSCSRESSPRMWGCFRKVFFPVLPGLVFPTHVGVFLSTSTGRRHWDCLPHACGGVSQCQRLSR